MAESLRPFFPKDINATVRELTRVNGITARKLKKLVGSVYDVDAKNISRAVFTSLKRGHGAPGFKTKLCGIIGGSRKEDVAMKQCLTNRNDTCSPEQPRPEGCPERRISQASSRSKSSCGRKKRKSKCRRKRSRSKSGSCARRKKRRCGRKRRKSSCSKKRRSRRSKGCKKRRQRSRSCRSGGCKMRHGRKPCNSSKCKKKRRQSRRSGSCGGVVCKVVRKPCGSSKCKKKMRRSRSRRPKTCGPVTVIYPPTAPMINNKQPSNDEKPKDHQSSISGESSVSSVWYFS